MDQITVFIVEDDPMVLEINKEFLKKIPHFTCVGSAVTGEEALDKIKKLNPELVLLDKFLPDISGIEILVKLRSKRIPCDVIMITAARDADVIKEAMRLGAVDYMVKPFRFERYKKSLEDYYYMARKIGQLNELKQEDIDEWLGNTEESIDLPKGLNELTMKQIIVKLIEISTPTTAENLAKLVGMSRVTVRKYLDFLANNGKVTIEMKYGRVGRPTKLYSIA